MRQGQQHRRGRNRSNRKGQNPLTRNFESSGPDIKIRGTPAHVAEKYMSLARDALSSGDPVLAENYLQHAEHYNRIILAYREQQGNQPGEQAAGRQRSEGYSGDESGDEAFDECGSEDPARLVQPGDPQPALANAEAPPRAERSAERGEGRRQPRSRSNGQTQTREGRGQREPRRRERQRFGESDQQPDFLRRSVRRTRSEEEGAEGEEARSAPETAEIASEQD
jgi:hypothetical protein